MRIGIWLIFFEGVGFMEVKRMFKDTILKGGYLPIENDQQNSTRHEKSSEPFDSLP